MNGNQIRAAVFSVLALTGGYQIQKIVPSVLSSDHRVLYVVAQYKIAVGDTAAAFRLMQKAETQCREHAAKLMKLTHTNPSCPLAHS